jgi:hypothetical protein
MTDKLAFDVGLQEDATGAGVGKWSRPQGRESGGRQVYRALEAGFRDLDGDFGVEGLGVWMDTF